MTRLYLVRHGEPAETVGVDPGLTEHGHRQAAALADWFAARSLGPLRVATSPLRRTRETAAPLAAAWALDVRVVDAVRELPSAGLDVVARREWLRLVLDGVWDRLGDEQRAWRAGVLDAVRAIGAEGTDTVVVSHYVPVNVVVGAGLKDDRVTIFSPGHCSVTVVDVDATTGAIAVVELGGQQRTSVV